MLAFLKGNITDIFSDRIYLDVNGIGYEVFCSRNTLNHYTVDSEAKIYVYLYITDGAVSLYGFYSTEEKETFKQLNSISRIGPKLATSILSYLTPDDINTAILTENATALSSVPGLGKKTAQRLILELKEKVSGTTVVNTNLENIGYNMISDAVEALVALGFDGLSASKAVTSVKDAGTVEDLIKAALKQLSN